MRVIIFIAFVATAIIMSSCEWFVSKPAFLSADKLKGEWQLNSISQGKDSSGMGLLFILALTMSDSTQKDSSSLIFSFKKDTVIASVLNRIIDIGNYKVVNDEITMWSPKDTSKQVYKINIINDSSMSLSESNNSSLFFEKVKPYK